MIQFYLDNKKIHYFEIWYHYQKEPCPGGHIYMLEITLDEKKIIKKIEKMINTKIIDKSFCKNALNEFDNSFNLIQYTLDEIKESGVKFNIKWVFNNIEDVRIEKDNLIITGTASEALDNF